MTTHPEDYSRDLALLLDLPNESAERATAEKRLSTDAPFRGAFNELHDLAVRLEAMGNEIHRRSPGIDIVSEVDDSVAHWNWEQRDPVDRPFWPVEENLEAAAVVLRDLLPVVDIVPPVMEAVAASHQSEAEIEMPYGDIASALTAAGNDLEAELPTVDLVDSIMAKLPQKTAGMPSNVVPMRARPVAETSVVSSGDSGWRHHLGWVAAAVVCLAGAWWTYQNQSSTTDHGRVMVAGNEGVSSTPGPETPPQEEIFVRLPNIDHGPEMPVAGPDSLPVTPVTENSATPKVKGDEPLTLRDAINARRRDVMAFEQLASLSADEASRMLKEMDLSPEALLGAAQFLAPEDAAAVLRAALANDPENEGIKLALAKSLEGNPEAAGERQRYLEDLIAKNDHNGLPHFMMAADYLERGELGAGLDALSNGASRTASSNYALDSMRQREAVLLASGLDSDVARYIAVSTAGESAVTDIASLRNELLSYGAGYERAGDYDTAQLIYNAVDELGAQVYEGADLAVVQQAGLETRQGAMYALEGVFEVLQQPENLALLGESLNLIASSIYDVSQYVNMAQGVVNDPQSTTAEWETLIAHILSNGDVNIANLIGK